MWFRSTGPSAASSRPDWRPVAGRGASTPWPLFHPRQKIRWRQYGDLPPRAQNQQGTIAADHRIGFCRQRQGQKQIVPWVAALTSVLVSNTTRSRGLIARHASDDSRAHWSARRQRACCPARPVRSTPSGRRRPCCACPKTRQPASASFASIRSRAICSGFWLTGDGGMVLINLCAKYHTWRGVHCIRHAKGRKQ